MAVVCAWREPPLGTSEFCSPIPIKTVDRTTGTRYPPNGGSLQALVGKVKNTSWLVGVFLGTFYTSQSGIGSDRLGFGRIFTIPSQLSTSGDTRALQLGG